jgi:hypothetical protein
MTYLLDTSALIAFLDPNHWFRQQAFHWYLAAGRPKWATCPITENGYVRIVSQEAYRGGALPCHQLIQTLALAKQAAGSSYEFFPDELSLADSTLFLPGMILGPKLVTDAYLLGLAKKRGAKVATFDRRMPWQAIVGGSEELLEVIPV